MFQNNDKSKLYALISHIMNPSTYVSLVSLCTAASILSMADLGRQDEQAKKPDFHLQQWRLTWYGSRSYEANRKAMRSDKTYETKQETSVDHTLHFYEILKCTHRASISWPVEPSFNQPQLQSSSAITSALWVGSIRKNVFQN